MIYQSYLPNRENIPHIGEAQLVMVLDFQGENVTGRVKHVLATVLPGNGTGMLKGNHFKFVEKIPFPWAGQDKIFTVVYSGELDRFVHEIEGEWTTDWGEDGIFTLNFSN